MRNSPERRKQIADESLQRALRSQALTNLPTIYQEFMARGIAEADILPRENVFTFNAWRALGRTVKRGEHGVRIITWIVTPEKKNDDGSVKYAAGKRPKTAVVFHVSQTESLTGRTE